MTTGAIAIGIGAASPAQAVLVPNARAQAWTDESQMPTYPGTVNVEMTDAYRQAFMNIWGLSGGPSAWWTTFPDGDGSPAEWFAEGYRFCSMYGAHTSRAPSSYYRVYEYPGPLDWQKQRRVCDLILSVGGYRNLAIPAQHAQPDQAPRAHPKRVTIVGGHAKHRPQLKSQLALAS